MGFEKSGHKFIKCDERCTGCMYCDGGLAHCEICGGVEASLPIHCPGRRMSEAEADAVQARRITFVNGFWKNIADDVNASNSTVSGA